MESTLDALAKKLDLDPLDLRLKNAAKEGTRTAYGPRFPHIGYIETLNAIKDHPHYNAPLGPNRGRGGRAGP